MFLAISKKINIKMRERERDYSNFWNGLFRKCNGIFIKKYSSN
jgi:hypothetical protein